MLKPGVLLIYKTQKNGQWVGTVLLNACEIIERPSKKDGFCFKLFHPLEQSIWAVKVCEHLLGEKIKGTVGRKEANQMPLSLARTHGPVPASHSCISPSVSVLSWVTESLSLIFKT